MFDDFEPADPYEYGVDDFEELNRNEADDYRDEGREDWDDDDDDMDDGDDDPDHEFEDEEDTRGMWDNLDFE